MDTFVRAMLATVRREELLAPGDAVIVGFSGGPDSTALLAALAECRKFLVLAVHVNHGLRGADSDSDEASARAVAEKLGVEFEALKVAVKRAPGESPEGAARRVREAAFAEAAARLNSRAVATGHTRDDQAETVLYRAARGAGPRGLRGILPTRPLTGDIRLVRPILDASRSDVLAFLGRRGLPFATDATNADPRFARNRIRRDVLPALEAARPGAAKHLAALARSAGELDAWIAHEAAIALERAQVAGGLDAFTLSALPAALRHAVLELACPEAAPLHATHRNALDRLFTRPPRRVAALGRGWIANLRVGIVRFVAPAREPDPEQDLPVPGRCRLPASGTQLSATLETASPGFLARFLRTKTRHEEALDADRAPAPLTVGPPRRGERMRPLGAPGARRIADILLDLGVPASRRRESLVVRSADGRALWLVGHRIAEEARITGSTKGLLRLSATANPT